MGRPRRPLPVCAAAISTSQVVWHTDAALPGLEKFSTPFSADLVQASRKTQAEAPAARLLTAAEECTERKYVASLSKAAAQRDIAAAEKAFAECPSLLRSPRALKLMLHIYIDAREFTVAKALLLEVLDIVEPHVVVSFVVNSFTEAGNIRLVDEVFQRTQHLKNPAITAAALFAFRFYNDVRRLGQARAFSARSNFSRAPELLLYQLFELLMSESFDKTLPLARSIRAHPKECACGIDALLPYRLAIRHFALVGNVTAITTITRQMRDLNLEIPPSITNLILNFTPAFYPEVPLTFWLDYCNQERWTTNRKTRNILVRLMGRLFPSLKHQIRAYFPTPDPSTTMQSPRPQPCLSEYDRLTHLPYDQRLSYLNDMCRRGIVPPYYYFVQSFDQILRHGPREHLVALRERMSSLNYPLHCVGVDLAMLELEFGRDSNSEYKRQCIETYVLQYPLITLSKAELARLAKLYLLIDDPGRAYEIVDFPRQQTRDARYTHANYDEVSILMALQAQTKLKRLLAPLITDILGDKPLIYFNARFRRRLRFMLSFLGEPNTCIEDISRHNIWVLDTLKKTLDNLATRLP